MIGARRPHISTAVGNLYNTGLIRNGRSKIDIRDRDGLMKIACICYLAAKKRFDGLFSTNSSPFIP
jgi:hypothetical protein